MPGVRLELVQLTTPGPPATQYLPETLRFRLSAIFPATIYTTDDVTKKFWPRGNCRIFWATMMNFGLWKKKCFRRLGKIQVTKSVQTIPNFYIKKQKKGSKFRFMCTLRTSGEKTGSVARSASLSTNFTRSWKVTTHPLFFFISKALQHHFTPE